MERLERELARDTEDARVHVRQRRQPCVGGGWNERRVVEQRRVRVPQVVDIKTARQAISAEVNDLLHADIEVPVAVAIDVAAAVHRARSKQIDGERTARQVAADL